MTISGTTMGYAGPVAAPNSDVAAAAQLRLESLATPPGALGRLGQAGVWSATVQGVVPPREWANPHLVIFAGDHGVAAHGVSAFPPAITGAMVRTFVMGRSGVTAIAGTHGVSVRVLDISVDEEFTDLPEAVRAEIQEFKIRRSCGAIHLEDAMTQAEVEAALEAGAAVARAEIAAGADLLISGDMGIGNTTPAAALIAAATGIPVADAVGRGTGIDDAGLAHKVAVVEAALARVDVRSEDNVSVIRAISSPDLAATVGFIAQAAHAGVPVLLDGLMSVACGLWAERLSPGAHKWFAAGHRSTEPAQAAGLEALGLEPLLDLGLRLGEGSGAVAAVPVLRSAVAVMRDVALFSELGTPEDVDPSHHDAEVGV